MEGAVCKLASTVAAITDNEGAVINVKTGKG